MSKPTLHFFPFGCGQGDVLQSISSEAVLHAFGFPTLLANLFKQVPDLRVYDYPAPLCGDELTRTIGFRSFDMPSLNEIRREHGGPPDGYGVTGDLVLGPTCSLRIALFTVSTGEVVNDSRAPFRRADMIKTVHGTVHYLVEHCSLEAHMKRMDIPTDLDDTESLLSYLRLGSLAQLRQMIANAPPPDGWTVLGGANITPEAFLKEACNAFGRRQDSVVLQFMMAGFLESLGPGTASSLRSALEEVRRAVPKPLPGFERTLRVALGGGTVPRSPGPRTCFTCGAPDPGAGDLCLACRAKGHASAGQVVEGPPSPSVESAQTPFAVITIGDGKGGERDLVSLIEPGPAGLPGEAILGQLRKSLKDGGTMTSSNFVANRNFLNFLHDFISRVAPESAGFQAEAGRIGNGSIVMMDGRTATPLGAVPPEDILGAFEVQEGRVVPGSFQPSPNYSLLTANGFIRLDDELMDALRTELRAKIG